MNQSDEREMTAVTTKSERINLRLTESAKALIERAASCEGRTVSGFILASALASAARTVHEHESCRLDEEDARRFFEALAKPIELSEALRDALSEHERRVDSR